MNRKKSLMLVLIVCIACLCILCACNFNSETKDEIVSIELVTNSNEVELGLFSVDNYSVSVSYKSGAVENIPLTEEMISDTELLKFYTYGTKKVDFTTLGVTFSYTFNVVRRQIKDVYLEGFVYNAKTEMYTLNTYYTGEDFDIQVAGDVPSGSLISFYNGAGSFKNVGSYDFVCYVSCDNYETKTLKGNITINKAVYDMSGVAFDGVSAKGLKSVPYSGNAEELKLTGDLPDGVEVEYEIVSTKSGETLQSWPVNCGNYIVNAVFKADTVCHEEIPSLYAYLQIVKCEVDLTGISFDDTEITYDGDVHVFKLTNEALLTDKTGKLSTLVDFTYENNQLTNAGTYIVKANFTVKDTVNYSVTPSMSARVVINKASYDMSNVYFDNESFEYDGNSHSIEIAFTSETIIKTDEKGNEISREEVETQLPDGVSVSYINNNKSNAGTYDVQAVFTHSNKNYNDIEPIIAVMRISQATIDTTSLTYDCAYEVPFEEKHYQPVLVSLPKGVNSVSYEYQYTVSENGTNVIKTVTEEDGWCYNARQYTLVTIFDDVDPNYETPSNFTRTFIIDKRTINDEDIVFNDSVTSFDYDGEKHKVEVLSCPYNAKVVYIIRLESNNTEDDGIKPGIYLQETQFEYFNGLETVTQSYGSEMTFDVVFNISSADFIFEDKSVSYDGEKTSIEFAWDSDGVNYSLLNRDFADIKYFYKLKSEDDATYLSEAPTDVGVYSCKAVFSEYLTATDAGTVFTYVVRELTITPKVLTIDDVLAFNLSTKDYVKAVYSESYTIKTNETTDKSYSDLYIQQYSFSYDGANRILSSLYETNYGSYSYDCYYAFGNNETSVYSKYSSTKGDYSGLKTFAINHAGYYVFDLTFEPNSNCEYEFGNDLLIKVDVAMLGYDENDFKTQSVSKNSESGVAYDVSGISPLLNAKVNKYSYEICGDSSKPLSYAETNEDYYYVFVDISIDDSYTDIDFASFDSATINTSLGIVDITNNGIIDNYYSYTFKIKVMYE